MSLGSVSFHFTISETRNRCFAQTGGNPLILFGPALYRMGSTYLGQSAMARRRVLTDEQLEELLALPASEPVLIRHWTLSPADLAS